MWNKIKITVICTSLLKRIFIFLCLLFTVTALFSQTISGKVENEQHKAIVGAIVMLLNGENEIISSIETDSSGLFALPLPTDINEPKALYVTCFGYKNKVIENITTLNIGTVLLENAALNLDAVNVTADRPMLIRETDKFVITSVYNSPLAQGKTIVDFLKYAPLINLSREGELEILGKGKATIYINGRPSSADLNSIPAENIEKVEIITHPGSQYAAAERGGVVNIILHRPPEDGVLVNIGMEDRQKERWALNSPSLRFFLDAQKGKLNITTGLSAYYGPYMSMEDGVYHYYTDSLDAYTHTKQLFTNYGASSFLNLDYRINKHHIIGFRLEGSVSHQSENNVTEISYRRLGSAITDSANRTQSELKQDKPNYRLHGNFNYNIIFNAKSKLSFDFDYNRYQSTAPRYFQYDKTGTVNDIRSNFLTRSKTLMDGYSFKTDFKHNFTDDMKLGAGGSVYGAVVDNPYFYGNKINNDYVSDTLQTNHFIFKDITAAVYLNFDWDISDQWSLSAGLRGEYYTYNGVQQATGEISANQYPNIFPSLSVYYTPHDNHELSFDFSSTYFYPGYLQLNPFKIYYSPNLYEEGNPYLNPSVDYTFDLTYILFSDYTFALSYEFCNQSFYSFTEPVSAGVSRKITKNIGKDHSLYFTFSLNKYLCNKYWLLSFNADVDYFKIQAAPSNIMFINDSGVDFSFNLKNEIALCKKKDWKLSVFCRYRPSNKGVASTWGTLIDVDASISKTFKTGALSFGVSNILDRPFKIFTNNSIYEYTTNWYSYWRTYWVSYSIKFGNNKVKGTEYRENKINNKMQ